MDATDRQVQLDRMKRRATGLLVLMAAVFVAARMLEPSYPWLGYVRATAEAAMVGGLADWFAITALFRHPLGIPIPHTAIIPTRKARLGRSLGNFVQQHFLSREVLAAKLRDIHITRRAAEWVSRPENSRAAARYAASALRSAATAVPEEEVYALLDRSAVERLRRVQVAPVLAKGLALLTENHRHQQMLDKLLKVVGDAVLTNEEVIREKVYQSTPWWVPTQVDDRIHERVVSAIERTLDEVAADPNHPLRHHFDALLADFITRLRESPEVIARAEAIKLQLLNEAVSRQLAAGLWEEIKRGLARHAEGADEDGNRAPGAVERWLSAMGDALLADAELQAKVDHWVVEAVLAAVEQHRDEVGRLIEHTVSLWNPEETSRRIELQVGRDLQFVRINGTIVGGLVGLLLYSLSRLLAAGGPHP